MPQNLDQPASASTKYEQMAIVRVVLERFLHLQRQTVEAAPHVGVASRQPNSRAIRGLGSSSPLKNPDDPHQRNRIDTVVDDYATPARQYDLHSTRRRNWI
jgi:hypothetical protein